MAGRLKAGIVVWLISKIKRYGLNKGIYCEEVPCVVSNVQSREFSLRIKGNEV
jgi:hypothetical protein